MANTFPYTERIESPLTLAQLFILLGYHFGFTNELRPTGQEGEDPPFHFDVELRGLIHDHSRDGSFLWLAQNASKSNEHYELSDRGKVMIESLKRIPVPILRAYWAMPDDPVLEAGQEPSDDPRYPPTPPGHKGMPHG